MRLLPAPHFRALLVSILLLLTGRVGVAGEVVKAIAFGQDILVLQQGKTLAKVAPDAGANVFSIQVDGTEFLHQPTSAKNLAGVSCGVPILYPTPNRVRNATLTFEGNTVDFEPNAGPNFIHGLVNRSQWRILTQKESDDSAQVTLVSDFAEGSELEKRFPFPHQLLLKITIRDRSVRWDYTVDNSDGSRSVPFGFALHPYFRYQGSRAETYLTIPASHWMQSERQLPTGKLIAASELDYPLNQPLSLKNTQFDDVFFGVSDATLIDFRDSAKQIKILASDEFTHLVVWTPDRPFFGIENQTCSTDAHNLFAKGLERESNLQVCSPGETMTGWVEYRFPNLAE
ncbi:MAG: aldose 1-epimerase [Planctomycetota bacterium]